MISLSAQQVAEIISADLHASTGVKPESEFQFDSRRVNPGDVFLALKGEHADGHDFVADAISRGAAFCIVTKPVEGEFLLVADVLKSIASLAKFVRNELKDLKVIGITGSQGKTTTKDMLNSILQMDGETIAAQGSFNNDLGVPLTLLRCKSSTKFCVVEMGARHGGDIADLVDIATPNVGAVLKVGNAHLGEFGSRENIAKAKGELILGLKPGAVAVLGTYDEFTPNMKFASGVKKVTFGETHECDVRAADVELRGGYAHFDLVTPESREPVSLRVLGLHQIPNALAAAAIAHSLKIATARIASALSMHESASKWRMELHEINGVLLINDSYNANPESMEAALRTLALLTQERGGRSWAFLATMHELGPESAQLHQQIGQLAAHLGIDHLVAIANQDLVSQVGDAAITTHSFSNREAAETLIPLISAGDVVLVKASRAEHLEQLATAIIESLTDNQKETGSEGEMQ